MNRPKVAVTIKDTTHGGSVASVTFVLKDITVHTAATLLRQAAKARAAKRAKA
jgi:hypothetical protein